MDSDRIRKSNVEVHARESMIYDTIHPEIFGWFEQRRMIRDLDYIVSLLPAAPAIRALDIGCGTGNLTLKLLQRGFEVKAVDISPHMIEVLKSHLAPAMLPKVELVVADAECALSDTALAGQWDVISFSAVLHHLPDYKSVLAQAMHQLRPGGLLYVCHEPLPKTLAQAAGVKWLARRILQALDAGYIYGLKFLVYSRWSVRMGRRFKRIDYTWSDFHLGTGIDATAILKWLEGEGMSVLVYETHSERYSSLLAMLDNRWKISPPSKFRFIAQNKRVMP